jgi:vacuolar-type H+-ATPase subunit I/STV1
VNASVDQFCDRLRDRLGAIEGWFESVKTNRHAPTEQAEKALRDKLEAVRTKLQAQKEHFEQTWANLKARAHQKLAETKEAVSEWKAKGERRRLNARADWAEAYAADAVDFALVAIDEALEAVLESAVARMDVDQAQSAAPPSR